MKFTTNDPVKKVNSLKFTIFGLGYREFVPLKFLPAKISAININESRYKQRGVTPHFSTKQYLMKKILRKVEY